MLKCRVCGSSDDKEFIKIFHEPGEIEKTLFSCCQISVSEELEPDAQICSACNRQLKQLSDFKMTAIKNDQRYPENRMVSTLRHIAKLVELFIDEHSKMNIAVESRIPGQLLILELGYGLSVKMEVDELVEHLENADGTSMDHDLDPFNYEDYQATSTDNIKDEPEEENYESAVAIKDENFVAESDYSSSDSEFLVTTRAKTNKKIMNKATTVKKTKRVKKPPILPVVQSPLMINKFYCTYCEEDFKNNRVTFMNHLNMHTLYKFILHEIQFKECTNCQKIFKSDDELVAHTNETKNPCTPFKHLKKLPCNYCTRKCESEDDLKEHMIFKHFDFLNCPLKSCKQPRQGYNKLYLHFRFNHPTHLKTNKELFCTYCNEKFDTMVPLEKHRKTDNSCIGKRYPCPTKGCVERFGCKKLLKLHLDKEKLTKDLAAEIGEDYQKLLEEDRIKNKIIDSLTCPKCHKVLKTMYTLKFHCRSCCPDTILLKVTRNPFRCDICKRATNCTNRDTFEKHRNACKLIIRKCSNCSQVFKNTVRLLSHQVLCCPTEKNSPRCLFCDKIYNGEAKESNYRNHQRMHVAFQESLKMDFLVFHDCVTCNKIFSNQDLLAQHAVECDATVNENEFPCGDCEAVLKTSDILKEHQYFKHQTLFECPISTCKSQYRTAGLFYNHMRGTHVGFFEENQDFKCIYCEERFANFPLLNKHLRKSGNSYLCKGKKHLCYHCDKKFGSRTLLRNHLRMMKNTVMCDDCGKECQSPSDLVVHKRTHTHEKPFSCNVCQKTFQTLGQRNSHLKSHMVDKTHACDKCNYMGKSRLHLRKHEKDCHSGKFSCPMCDSVLGSIRSVETHLKSMHHLDPENVKKVKKQCKIIKPDD